MNLNITQGTSLLGFVFPLNRILLKKRRWCSKESNFVTQAVNVESLKYVLFNASCDISFLLVFNGDLSLMKAHCTSLLKG